MVSRHLDPEAHVRFRRFRLTVEVSGIRTTTITSVHSSSLEKVGGQNPKSFALKPKPLFSHKFLIDPF